MKKKLKVIISALIILVVGIVIYGQRNVIISRLTTRFNKANNTTDKVVTFKVGNVYGTENINKTIINQKNTESGFVFNDTDILKRAVQLLGKPYGGNVGNKGGNTATSTPYSVEKVSAIDCSGLIWWTLCGLSNEKGNTLTLPLGQGNESRVPVDCLHWISHRKGKYFTPYNNNKVWKNEDDDDPNSQVISQFDIEDATKSGGMSVYGDTNQIVGHNINVLKVNDPVGTVDGQKYEWYNYYDGSTIKELPAGTIVVSYSTPRYGDNLNYYNHSWIALGNLGTSDATTAANKLVEKGIMTQSQRDEAVNNGWIYSDGSSNYWRIESNGSEGVRINNCTPGSMSTESGGNITKKIGSIWAFQVANSEKPQPQDFSFQIEKKDNTGELLRGAEFKYMIYDNMSDDATMKQNIEAHGLKMEPSPAIDGVYITGSSSIDRGKSRYICILETKQPEGCKKYEKIIKVKVTRTDGDKLNYELIDNDDHVKLSQTAMGSIILINDKNDISNSYNINLKKVDENGTEISSAKFDTTFDYINPPANYYTTDANAEDALFLDKKNSEYELFTNHEKKSDNVGVTPSGYNIVSGAKIGSTSAEFALQAAATNSLGMGTVKLYKDYNKKILCDNVGYADQSTALITDKYTFKEQKIKGYIQDTNTYVIKVIKSYGAKEMQSDDASNTFFGRITKVELCKKDGNNDTVLASTNITYKTENKQTTITTDWTDNKVTSGNVTVELNFNDGNLNIQVKEKNKKAGSYDLSVMKKSSGSTTAGDVADDAIGEAGFNVESYEDIEEGDTTFGFGGNKHSISNIKSQAGKYTKTLTRNNIDETSLTKNGKTLYDIWKVKETSQPVRYNGMKHQLVFGVIKQYDSKYNKYNIQALNVFQVSDNQNGNGINWTKQNLTRIDYDEKGNQVPKTVNVIDKYATYIYEDGDGCKWNIVIKSDGNNGDNKNHIIVTARDDSKYSLNVMKKSSGSSTVGDISSDAIGKAKFNVELYENIPYRSSEFKFGQENMNNFGGSFVTEDGVSSKDFTRDYVNGNSLQCTLNDGSKTDSYDIWKIVEEEQPTGYSSMKHPLVLGVKKQYDADEKTFNVKEISVFQASGDNQDELKINWNARKLVYTDTNNIIHDDVTTCTEYATYIYEDDDGCKWNLVLGGINGWGSLDKEARNKIVVTARDDNPYTLNLMKKRDNSKTAGDNASDALEGADFDVELYKNVKENDSNFKFDEWNNQQLYPMQITRNVKSLAGKFTEEITRDHVDQDSLEYETEDGNKLVSYDIWKIKENNPPPEYNGMKHQLVLGVKKQYDSEKRVFNIASIKVFQVAGDNPDSTQIDWSNNDKNKLYKIKNLETQEKELISDKIIKDYATYLYEDADGCQWNIVLRDPSDVASGTNKTNIVVTARNEKKFGVFNLDVTKFIKDTEEPLSGAKFKVSIVNEKDKNNQPTINGKTIVDHDIITGFDGKVVIKNIRYESKDELKVTITETEAPFGYYRLMHDITFTVTPVDSADKKGYVLKGETPNITYAKKVEVKEGEVLVEAENRKVEIHKGVKKVENQDSGYYDKITGDTYESEEDAKKVLHDWVINVPLDEAIVESNVYKVEDPINERLTYEGVASVKIKDRVDLVENTDYKVNYDEETRLLTITFKDAKQNMDFSDKIKNNTDGTIEIRFNTKFALNDQGKLLGINQSIPNQATLVYENNSRIKSEKPEIHTGGVGIYKYDNVTKKALVGAHFKIATSEENARNKKFLKDTEGNDVEVVTDENGKAEFTGLEFGEDAMDNAKYKTIDETTGAEVYKYDWSKVETIYYIVETEAPGGYKLIEQPRKVVVKKDNYVMEDITSLLQVDNEQKVFDLALRKWVTQAIVTENGKTVVTETGHHAEDDPEEVVKVDLKKSKLNKVTVKFRYSIRVTNEGEVAGEAKEIRDDIPKGLKFVAEDNPDWREEYGQIVTDKLAGTTLQPGESAEVEIVLTWVNSEENMGVMVNTAEIEKDHNDFGIPDRDSTPGNNVPGEDDIDDAPVMITIKTGATDIAIYTSIALGALLIISVGGVVIKKKVVEQIQ